jgi:muconate cycloisomerase
MRIENLRFRVIKIPFRTVFSHANATRSDAEGIWVEAYSVRGASGCGEGCPRDYVTGETVRSARAFFDTHRPELEERIRDLASLRGGRSTRTRPPGAPSSSPCSR